MPDYLPCHLLRTRFNVPDALIDAIDCRAKKTRPPGVTSGRALQLTT